MSSSAEVLRRARRDAGLTQRELADRAGVTQPEISSYEKGRRQPSVPTLGRLVSAAGFDLELGLRERLEPASFTPMSVGDLAGHVRDEGHEQVRWRLVREFLTEIHGAADREVQRTISSRPRPFDRRWDAMLAAVTEHVAHHRSLRCPAWTQDASRFLEAAWFLSPLPAARAAAMETSPASFRRRLVFLQRSDLEVA